MSFLPAVRGGNAGGVSQSSTRTVVQSTTAKVPITQQPLIAIQKPGSRVREQIKDAQAYAAAEQSQQTTNNNTKTVVRTRPPAVDDPPVLGLRVVDARYDTCDSAQLDQLNLWAQLNLDELNEGLAQPLSAQEIAINNVRRGGPSRKRPEDIAAEQAHRGIDVSRLVPYYPLRFGSSLVGSRASVLFLHLENTASPASHSSGGVSTPLDTVSGEVVWRARFPSELETKVEHWARSNGSATDEERYHAACVDREIFTVRPSHGRLAPGQSMTVEITYHPKFVGEHVVPLLVQVRGGKHFSLVLKGSTVAQLPATFSFDHLKEITPADALQPAGKKSDEEQKESTAVVPSTNPFLPSAVSPTFLHTLHSMPIGLSEADAPIQPFVLRNHSRDGIVYRVDKDSFNHLAKANYNFPILSLAGPSYGTVAAGSIGALKFRFRPLEVKRYEFRLRVWVRGEAGGPEVEQTVLFIGDGILPSTWSLAPFPLSTSAPVNSLFQPPGQLVEVSQDRVEIGDVPVFSKTSRLFTLRSLAEHQELEFAFIHSLHRASKDWDESLKAERRVRAAVTAEEEDEITGTDTNSSIHAVFTPSTGLLAPGEAIQVRVDLFAGHAPSVLEALVQLVVRVFENAEYGATGGSYASSAVLSPSASPPAAAATSDVFGYNKVPSLALTTRPPISSSQPHANKMPRVPGKQSVIGVGQGYAGADVRVDYPPPPPAPLSISTITKRRGLARGPSDASKHLEPAISSLASVPSRATWFSNSAAVVDGLRQRSLEVQWLTIRGRILTPQQLEKDEKNRLDNPPDVLLPQQARTEVTTVGSASSQRFFVPAAELSSSTTKEQPVTDEQGFQAVDGTLHDLLRAALHQTSVHESFEHLKAEEIPFFADLLHSKHHHPKSHTTHPTAPESALAHATSHFQNLTEVILNDTLFNLMAEASSTDSNFSLEKPLPKTFVKRPMGAPKS